MNKTPRVAAAFMALALIAPVTALAEDEHNVSTGVTPTGASLGLHGVDSVALSTLNAVVAGSAVHTVVHEGVAYYFASAESARMFSAAPEKYAPQYGGFCAYAVAKGKKYDGDPRYADIVDGRLYLFVNAAVFALYKEDPQGILAQAETTWASIRHSAVESL